MVEVVYQSVGELMPQSPLPEVLKGHVDMLEFDWCGVSLLCKEVWYCVEIHICCGYLTSSPKPATWLEYQEHETPRAKDGCVRVMVVLLLKYKVADAERARRAAKYVARSDMYVPCIPVRAL